MTLVASAMWCTARTSATGWTCSRRLAHRRRMAGQRWFYPRRLLAAALGRLERDRGAVHRQRHGGGDPGYTLCPQTTIRGIADEIETAISYVWKAAVGCRSIAIDQRWRGTLLAVTSRRGA